MTAPGSADTPPAGSAITSQSPTVGQQTAAGVAFVSLQKWVTRISGLVTIAVLTRFLTPEEFGTVAAVSTLLPFFYLVADLGFSAYIVQVKKIDERLLSTGFWFAIVSGLVLAGVLAWIAPVLPLIFRSPDIVPVTRVLALSVILSAAASVPSALLRRSMRFKDIAWQGACAAVAAQGAAVAMALTGWGVWALVAQVLVNSAVVAVLAWVTVQWHPRLQFSGHLFRTMARYGSQVLGVELIATLRAWGEAAIISATLGVAGLGYLSIAQRLIQVIQDLTGATLVPVTTVAFARIRENRMRLQGGYLRALRVTYAVTAMPLAILVVTAPLVIPLTFGDGWGPSHRVAQILALAGAIAVGASLDHGLFYGLGRPGRWFWYALVVDGVTIAVTAVLARHGLQAVAWGFLAVTIIATVARWFLVAPLLEAKIRTLAGQFGFLGVALAMSVGSGWGLLHLSHTQSDQVQLLLVSMGILIVHSLVVRFLAPSVYSEIGALASRLPLAARIQLRRRT